ncbi:MAG: hypothetical protein WCI22_05910 [Actinomycetota bacterium]
MNTDLLDQLRTLVAHLDADVAPVTVDELRPVAVPIEIDTVPAAAPASRRYGRFLAIAAAVALVAAAVVVFAGRHSPATPSTPPVASGTTIAPVTTHGSATSTATATTTPPSAVITIPPGGITMAFGGSVMLGAARELTRVGVLAIAPGFTPGGTGISRSDQSAITKAIELDAALSPIAILQIGDDGPIAHADYEHLLTKLADRVRVLVLTVHGNGQWFAPNNAFIRSLPARFPNVTVVDWDAAVTSGDVTGILADGMHLGIPARTAYAAIVGKALERAQHEAPPPTTTTSTTTPPADGACEWKVGDIGFDGGFGHSYTFIPLTNVGAHTCTLPKVTSVTGYFDRGSVEVRGTEGVGIPVGRSPATVPPDGRVSLTLDTVSIDGCTVVSSLDKAAYVTITLSDGSVLTVALQRPVSTKCGLAYSQLGAAS